MRTNPIGRNVILSFASTGVLLIALVAITWTLTQRSRLSSEYVTQTLHVISRIGVASSELYRADAARLAFGMDASTSHANERDTALTNLRLLIDELGELTTDNAGQSRRVSAARTVLPALEAAMRQLPEAAMPNDSEAQVDRLQPLLEDLRSEEERLLTDRQQTESEHLRSATLAFVALVLLMATVVPVMYWRVRAELLARQQAEAMSRDERRYDEAHARALVLFNARSDRQAALDGTLALLAEDTQFPVSAFYAMDAMGGSLRLLASRSLPGHAVPLVRIDDGLIGQAARSGLPVYLDRLAASPGWQIETGLARLTPAALLMTPVLFQSQVLGVLVLACSEHLGPRSRAFVDRLCAQLGVALHNLQQLEELNLLADELRRSAEQIHQTNQDLERAGRIKSEFLANMSHELRTPLNAILGFSEILRDGLAGPLQTDQQEYVNDIHDSGRHLLSLINDVLDLSKVEAGQMELELTVATPAELVATALTVVRERAAARRIVLKEQVQPAIGALLIDPRRTKQILFNLLSNAVKFTEEGGRVQLAVERVPQARLDAMREAADCRIFRPAQAAAEWLQVEVSDTGIGMAPDALQRLFTPFVQIDSALGRRFDGTGLGLTLVRQLTELQGGGLMVHSTPDAGSRFTVWLPWRDPVADGAQAPAVAAVSTVVAAPDVAPAGVDRGTAPEAGPTPLILLVEDDARAAGLMRLQLEDQGYRVEVSTRAEGALQLAQDLQPQAIVLDIILPDMDGWQLLAALKEQAQTQRIPVVIASITDESRRGFALGASQVLVKPVAQDDLVAALDALGLHGRVPAGEVLVVDDDPKAVRLICTQLRAAGIAPREAYGGEQALELVRQKLPDLIVLDLTMPQVSGFDVLEALAQQRETAGIPVLVLTAKLVTAADREQLRGRVQRILDKSDFTPGSLVAEVRRALVRRRSA